MDIQASKINEVTIITISGSADALTAPTIAEFVNELIASGNIQLVADLSEVTYLSSAGVRVLLGVIKETRKKGGDLYLVDIQPDVEKVLNLSGLPRILKIFPDIDSAVNNFS